MPLRPIADKRWRRLKSSQANCAAEDRIAELEAEVQQYRERAERAEKWLRKISMEIEDRLIKQTEERRRQVSRRL
jgi:cell fate (sporulation/competence/biofilm development) regulator YmcA (YheA/YmcA/DUF963 family)